MTNWRSRKLLVMLLVFCTATALLWVSKMTSAEWVSLVKWAFGIYAAGNVGEHVSATLKGQNNGG